MIHQTINLGTLNSLVYFIDYTLIIIIHWNCPPVILHWKCVVTWCYSYVQWPSYHLKLLVSWVFVQQFVQTVNKETSKVCITLPFWGERTHWWPVHSLHKGTVTRKMFPSDDIIVRLNLLKTHISLSWARYRVSISSIIVFIKCGV